MSGCSGKRVPRPASMERWQAGILPPANAPRPGQPCSLCTEYGELGCHMISRRICTHSVSQRQGDRRGSGACWRHVLPCRRGDVAHPLPAQRTPRSSACCTQAGTTSPSSAMPTPRRARQVQLTVKRVPKRRPLGAIPTPAWAAWLGGVRVTWTACRGDRAGQRGAGGQLGGSWGAPLGPGLLPCWLVTHVDGLPKASRNHPRGSGPVDARHIFVPGRPQVGLPGVPEVT
jgi:hypothetical protein